MFIANLKYKKSTEEVNKVLEAHLEYLDKYFEKEIYMYRKKSFPELGGVILFDSNNLEEAKKILYEDPFYIEEIADYEIIEFQPVKFSQNFQ